MAGSISSAGIGSGLDVSNIIKSLMKVEQVPLAKLQSAATNMQTKLSAFGQIQGITSAFRDATAPLFKDSTYNGMLASSTDSTSVSATALSTAAPGSYSISVANLSATQNLVSATGQFNNGTDVVGTGTITISLGSWSAGQASFAPKAGATDIVIPIGASENTLQGIRDKINAAAGGVSATLVSDANGVRLALQSTATGAENGFRVTVADDDTNNTDAAGLSRLAFDPPSGAGQLSLTQSAANAQATINGIQVSSATNTLANSVDGLTLTLSKATTSPVTLTVARNTDAVKTAVTSFIASYNALSQILSAATKYDPAAKAGALLQGDATATGLQNQLRAQVSQAGKASTAFASLSSIGIEFQKDGSLKLNDAKFSEALKNLPELGKALGNVDANNPELNGFAKKMASWADTLLAPSGTLPGKTKSLQTQIDNNQRDQDKFNDRLTDIEARLRARYTALDATMARANALSSYVTQQITTWNKSKG